MDEVRFLANFPITSEVQLDIMAQRFKYYSQYYSQIDSIVYVNSDGFVNIDTASKEVILTDSDVNLKDRDYFIAAMEGKEYIHDIVISRASNNPTIIFSVPVFSPDKLFKGVVFSAVNLSKLNEMLSETLYGKNGNLTIINNEGAMITHLTNDNMKDVKTEVLKQEVDKGL